MMFSYNWLQSFFDKKLPKPEKLAEVLTMHSFEVESLTKKGKDWLLDIDITPNRASDCFSHIGIAREIAAITNYKLQNTNYKQKTKYKTQITNKSQTKDFIKIEVKDKNTCQRYTARVITDVKIGDLPKWIKERLETCGLQPINNVVDIANYVMLEFGQPLHTFDFSKIESVNPKSQIPNPKSQTKKIIVRRAKKGEKITTLDNNKYDLNENILVIADSKEPLAIAGIKGGKKAEIDKKTKTIVLESANFEYRIIRKASRILNLKTDASWRFEHGLDPNLTEQAINRAAALIQEIAGGKITQGLSDFYPKKPPTTFENSQKWGGAKKIKLDLDYVEKLLGAKIPERAIKDILNMLSFETTQVETTQVRPRHIIVTVPTFRLDISIPEDLIEEIGRIYGYEKIKPVLPLSSLIPPEKNQDIFWQNFIKNILKELYFTEVYNYSFISEKDKEIFLNSTRTVLVEIENPMSVEQKYLRPTLLINLLKNIKSNIKNYEEMKLFEIGKQYKKDSRIGIDEKTMLSGIIIKKDKKELFYELKGIVDLLLNKLGISALWYDEYKATPEESNALLWHPKKCAEIKVGGEEIGFMGEISPKILKSLKINTEVCAFEIDFERLEMLCSEEQEYQPISLFPAAVRDLAVLVPRKVKVVDVLNKINISGGALVRDVDLFDMYEGKELPEDKKNLAFHIIYQAEDRTLLSKEIDEVHTKIIKALEKNPAWEVRK